MTLISLISSNTKDKYELKKTHLIALGYLYQRGVLSRDKARRPKDSVARILQYSPSSINVTLINVNSLYLLTKSYPPHIAN
jgi:hypothetical protein